MNILIDLTSLADNLSGIERFCENVAFFLVREYHSVNTKFILLFKSCVSDRFRQFENCEDIEFIVLPRKNKLYFSQFLLPRELYKHKADFYLFLAFPAPFFFFNRRAISAIHDIGCWDCPQTMTRISKWYFRIMFRKAVARNKKVITVSDFSKTRICEKLRVKESNIWIISNGLMDSFLKPLQIDTKKAKNLQKKYSLPDKYYLCLSTLEPRKNLSLLIRAFQNVLLKSQGDINLVLAGRKGWKVDNLLSGLESEVKDRIFITGFIDDADLPAIYFCAEWFVFPSRYEGFGIPVIEAMSQKTPVICSDIPSVKEIVGEYAVMFRNDDCESLENVLLHTLNIQKEQKDKFIEGGFERSRTYSFAESADKLYTLLKGVSYE